MKINYVGISQHKQQMKLARVFQPFSILTRMKAKQRLLKGSNFPRSATESIPYIQADQLNTSLSPFQQYLVSNKAMERPFTGRLWDQMSAGFYHCIVCDTRLFTFNHKYQAQTGYASFWRTIQGTIITEDEQVIFDEVNQMRAKHKSAIDKSIYKRCQCAKCNTHLGAVFIDGPPPTFLRYSINSALLKFYDFPDFPSPHINRRKKQENRKNRKVTYLK